MGRLTSEKLMWSKWNLLDFMQILQCNLRLIYIIASKTISEDLFLWQNLMTICAHCKMCVSKIAKPKGMAWRQKNFCESRSSPPIKERDEMRLNLSSRRMKFIYMG